MQQFELCGDFWKEKSPLSLSQISQEPPNLEKIAMTSQCQGIQQLLQAERRAKDKLEEAKKWKGKRLKQAKEEAMAEIDQYRMQRGGVSAETI
jgi:multidrug efflux pump subunit AcrB